MKRFHRWTALVLAFVLTLSLLSPAARAAQYVDLDEDHWAYSSMDRAVKLSIINGYGGGVMAPDDTLTWAQYLAMLARTFYPWGYGSRVGAGLDWAQAGYEAVREAGLLPEEDFLPVDAGNMNIPILRQEAAVLLSRMLPEDAYRSRYFDPEDTFSDFLDLPEEYREGVRALYVWYIANGKGDGTFGGGDQIRRCDGTVLLLRTMDQLDAERYGENMTVTVRAVNQQGVPLGADMVVETSVGQNLRNVVEADFLRHRVCLTSYSDSKVSAFRNRYTLVYRDATRVEAAQEDFEAAVARGEATWDDYYDQDFWLWVQGDNTKKRVTLYGDPDKNRFATKAEAEANMKTISIPAWKLDKNGKKVSTKYNLTVNAALAEDVLAIFTEIYNDPEQFPIQDIGGYRWSNSPKGEHSPGTAIDINPTQNYQVRDGNAMVGDHWTPDTDPRSMGVNGSVVRIFAEHGWSWGGNAWSGGGTDPNVGYHDYMHFSYFGT